MPALKPIELRIGKLKQITRAQWSSVGSNQSSANSAMNSAFARI
jgi:hypothetical protein